MNPRELDVNYEPHIFLSIYKSENSDSDDDEKCDAPRFYTECHKPLAIDNQIIVGAGKPMTKNSISKMGKFFADQHLQSHKPLNFKALIPDHVLLAENRGDDFRIIWTIPPGIRTLNFHEKLGIPSGEAQVPGLLFMASRQQLSVFAIKTESIDLNTNLYYAPFYNIYDNGSVCTGTMQKPDKPEYFDQAIEEWENGFFYSYFTHLNIGKSPIDGNLNLLWSNLMQTRKPFPNSKLIKHRSKLKNLLES
ncbi:MAG: hypothetical protein ABJH98_17900 [Reichenbachiella sp.]|uniref:hypothetical protein n=1 Tax=Reichenbachiella sp. TaxID=2184521 RepID=UPI00329964C5